MLQQPHNKVENTEDLRKNTLIFFVNIAIFPHLNVLLCLSLENLNHLFLLLKKVYRIFAI